MKLSKKILSLAIIYSIFLFINISLNDYLFLRNGYHIINNEKMQKKSINIDGKLVDIYEYQNFILISENSTNIELNDFKKIISNYDRIIIAEFSDFGYLFDRYKIYLNDDELKKIRYAHYIKPREIDKYNINQIEQRFWRAFNERRINIFYIPNHSKRGAIIENIKMRMKNYNETIPHLKNSNPYVPLISVLVISLYISTIMPILSILYVLIYFFLNSWSYVFIGIIFSFISWIKWKRYKKLGYLILLNIIFGVLIYGSGYTYFFIYKISVIRGVKLILITLPFVLFLVQVKNFKLNKKDIILSTLFLGIIATYYILRSGNFGFSSMVERNIRDFLEQTLYARPRFKELFAYIFVFSNPPTKFFKIFWNLGQSIIIVSILNTFLHFQTPIYLGVLRTINAFVISWIIYKLFILFKGWIYKK
ncbi:hypothetical protein SAMN02745164_00029 [Marinitoga hydrogenitolerans DSM 16785]|uniref:Uncharacterized protein n=1 Tax=Marinitoga hydrogenitolerans (strain DSM 16785 / JCM 12826 / AT1271) TaxID=1122195 RepID=A0A1M4S5E0_MARH1|nr:DUF5693 family protein [Marinitoga hydrogenitolerans]SHE27227.1 hypothetical protein SAMN02745164_00029 [Marinitoga hydrogenitolerans DSM 16785]